MNRLLSSLGTKIGAILLFVTAAAVLLVSGCSVGVLAYYGGYTDGGTRVRQATLSDYADEQLQTVAAYYESVAQKTADADDFRDELAAENTNYRFTVTDESGAVLLQNAPCADAQFERRDTRTVTTKRQQETRTLTFSTAAERNRALRDYLAAHDGISYSLDEIPDNYTGEVAAYVLYVTIVTRETATVTVTGQIPATLTVQDNLYSRLFWLDWLLALRDWLIVAAAGSLIVTVLLGIFLLCAAGHKAGVEGIHLNWADRIPFDLYLTLLILLALFPLCFLNIAAFVTVAALCVGAVWWLLLAVALTMSFATRAKAGTWWRNTVVFLALRGVWRFIRRIVRLCRRTAQALPLAWKTALVVAGVCILNLIILAMNDASFRLLFWLMESVSFGTLLVLLAANLRKLQKGGEALAAGQLTAPVDTAGLFGDCRRFGETLNHIGDGMTRAVDARMKSERMKTELITNVSHDIKTPLTSIINYVDLLQKEQPENENSKAYLDVLARQSARLKKLIEDLVEASKASSGTLAVERAPCDAGVLLSQTVGEYEERAAAGQLELVLTLPDETAEPVTILADGRHLWRVFDNLMNNICKYSLPATRVYLSLEQQNGRAVITFRNISRTPLNISGDELMERFVRGDSSRNTEGSGLGLSIARSLTELQGGTLTLAVDGDLFKITLSFPIIKG